jgi:hypothetical protein
MFSFLQKINPKKSHERRSESRSGSFLKRKDSTVSVPSADFSYNPASTIIDTYVSNNNNNKLASGMLANDKYGHHYINSHENEHFDTKNSKNRKSNSSFSSGYFTTGRFYEHKKKSNQSIGISCLSFFLSPSLSLSFLIFNDNDILFDCIWLIFVCLNVL